MASKAFAQDPPTKPSKTSPYEMRQGLGATAVSPPFSEALGLGGDAERGGAVDRVQRLGRRIYEPADPLRGEAVADEVPVKRDPALVHLHRRGKPAADFRLFPDAASEHPSEDLTATEFGGESYP